MIKSKSEFIVKITKFSHKNECCGEYAIGFSHQNIDSKTKVFEITNLADINIQESFLMKPSNDPEVDFQIFQFSKDNYLLIGATKFDISTIKNFPASFNVKIKSELIGKCNLSVSFSLPIKISKSKENKISFSSISVSHSGGAVPPSLSKPKIVRTSVSFSSRIKSDTPPPTARRVIKKNFSSSHLSFPKDDSPLLFNTFLMNYFEQLFNLEQEPIDNFPIIVTKFLPALKESNLFFDSKIFSDNMIEICRRLQRFILKKKVYWLISLIHLISIFTKEGRLGNDELVLILKDFRKLFEKALENMQADFQSRLKHENQSEKNLKNVCLDVLSEIKTIGKGFICSKIISALLMCLVVKLPSEVGQLASKFFGIRISTSNEKEPSIESIIDSLFFETISK